MKLISSTLQTDVDAIDDDALFGNEDDEEEDSEFVMWVAFLKI